MEFKKTLSEFCSSLLSLFQPPNKDTIDKSPLSPQEKISKISKHEYCQYFCDKVLCRAQMDYGNSKKTILVIGAYDAIYGILEDTEDFYGISIIDDYNIISIESDMADVKIAHYVKDRGVKVDYAILDIFILGMKIGDEEQKTRIDGIDIAVWLKELNKSLSFVFYSDMDIDYETCSKYNVKYLDKFNKYMDQNLQDHFIKKSPIRDEIMKKIFTMLRPKEKPISAAEKQTRRYVGGN